MDRWISKVAVVTGASSGIGAAIAKDMAERGVVVVAIARRLDKLEELAKNVKGKIFPKKCDLLVESEILSIFRWIEDTLGGVDILVNNAGVANFSKLMDGETEKWQNIIDTNFKALNICTREALKSMRNRGDNGHLFHISSVLGHHVSSIPGISLGIYTATKFGVRALTEALRIELQEAKSDIKITCISPGATMTEITPPPSFKHFLEPEDISEAVMYALSTKPKVQVHDIIIQPIGQTYS